MNALSLRNASALSGQRGYWRDPTATFVLTSDVKRQNRFTDNRFKNYSYSYFSVITKNT